MPDLLTTALRLTAAGCSIIPVRADGTKSPAVPWKPYITTPAGPEQITAWFTSPAGHGLGLVTGAVSGNLELTELEGRAAPHMGDLTELADASGLGPLWRRLLTGWMEISPAGGIHLLYRLTEPVPGNTKLARDEGGLVLAETRGEGGFVVLAPTPGTHHPTGKPWTLAAGGIDTIPTITADEREQLHAIVRTLDQTPEPDQPTPRPAPPRAPGDGVSPGDDYEQRTSWADILTPHGWTHVFTRGRTSYWRRPGKTIGISATTGHADDRDRLYVFSSSTDFETEKPYTKFGAYTLLHHGGDHTAAARQLRADGYGSEPTTAVGGDLRGLLAGQTTHTPPPALTVIHGGRQQPATDGANALAPQPATSTLERSEDGHAQQLIDAYGDLIRYCPQRTAWLAWDGTVWQWQPKGGGIVREYAKTIARAFPTADNAQLSHKRRALSAAGTSGCLDQARTDPRVVVDITDLDADPWTLNTPGGLVDLHDGTLRPPDPTALCTRCTTATPDFDTTSATWEAFLADTFGGEQDMLGYVQRLVGISLIGAVREQVLPFAHGLGANGKSTLLEALMHALRIGERGYAIAAPAEMLMIRKHSEHPAELAQLAGARLVVCSELDDGQRFAEAKVKQLTGSDTINARFLYGQPFSFRPSHTIWMLGNHRPQAASGGMAFWRRVKLLEFSRTVPPERRDPALPDKLAAAAGVVLAWAIAGAADYVRAGIREPASVAAATQAYALDQDTVGRFVDELVHLAPGQPGVRVPMRDVRAAYEAWCAAEGEFPVSTKRFGQELRSRWGVGEARSNNVKQYVGMTLLDLSAVTEGDGEPDGGRETGWYR